MRLIAPIWLTTLGVCVSLFEAVCAPGSGWAA
jgi:hypothetical protein